MYDARIFVPRKMDWMQDAAPLRSRVFFDINRIAKLPPSTLFHDRASSTAARWLSLAARLPDPREFLPTVAACHGTALR